jgi:hypothetical protein
MIYLKTIAVAVGIPATECCPNTHCGNLTAPLLNFRNYTAMSEKHLHPPK